jgi:hypothetical protein
MPKAGFEPATSLIICKDAEISSNFDSYTVHYQLRRD